MSSLAILSRGYLRGRVVTQQANIVGVGPFGSRYNIILYYSVLYYMPVVGSTGDLYCMCVCVRSFTPTEMETYRRSGLVFRV